MYKSKALSKTLDVISQRVNNLPKNVKIYFKAVFTSDTDYHFVYEVVKKGKVIKTIPENIKDNSVNNIINKYDIKPEPYFDDLTDEQVRYILDDLKQQTKEENIENESKTLY